MPKYAPVPTDPESPEPGSEYSEGSIEPDSDSAFSVGEVTPTADGGSGGETNLRQTRSQEENAKAAERMRSAGDDPDAYFLADVRPKALRKAVTAEMKHIRFSLKDTIAGFCKPNKPHRKVAQDLFNKWYAPAGAGAPEAKVKPAAEDKHAEASLVSDRDDISVGEVTPVVAQSVDQTPGPRSASPDDGPPTASFWRVEDLREDEQRLQAKYFQLTHPKASALCLSCAEPFHMDSICPAHTCAHCGTIDEHFSGACPTNHKCGKCRERGHAANTCPRRPVQGGKAGDACDICGRTGHVEEECSGLWRTIGKVDPERPAHTIPAKAMQKACYNCGSSSHWGDDCTELPDFILEKAGGKGTWSAENAIRYVSNGDVRGQQQPKGFGGGGGQKGARHNHYPQAYQLEQLDDY
ncbi:hypothetical protein B0A55_12224 [Friedmanniomyces simplex]|uniref:CCHC-type domain-containing protein n=1 Tax=Friedmanniomyces simplex TaxID=329884 RepID=A0A4U0WB33_9PEZI|nr:hypothetical protein B0A55_12224 [Friedmanniomyces simplex]